jgi:hypothetical protein
VHLEGFDKWNKFNDLNGTRTRDNPDCNILPQPTTLQLIKIIYAQFLLSVAKPGLFMLYIHEIFISS